MPTRAQMVKQVFMQDLNKLDSAASTLYSDLKTGRADTAVQNAFRKARLAYKRIEFISAYYSPETTKALNGPNIPEVDDDLRVNPPQGFQVLEELVFPAVEPGSRSEALEIVTVLRSQINRLRKISESNELTDSHVFDAMRLEIFRLQTLGITGFDSPVAFHSMPEAASALQALQSQLHIYELEKKDRNLAARLNNAFDKAVAKLQKATDFDSFDRLDFIKNDANALSALLLDAQNTLGIAVFSENRLLAPSARTLTDSGVYNTNYFVNLDEQRATPGKVTLGRMLFFNPVLSSGAGRSCASCHQPEKAFSDGETKSFAIGTDGRRISRNAPTLLNAGLQAVQFADSRVAFLEDQATDVIQNKQEMHGSLPLAVKALRQNPEYAGLFSEHYKDGVTESNLKNAIASYIRSLTAPQSSLDTYFQGGPDMLTIQQKKGFNVFMGKGKCATCHFFPLFNGTVPPFYQETESEVLGVPATVSGKNVDADLGKFMLTKREPHRYAFKTPTVRQISKTGPYMHNGVYKTLQQVVDFYDQGGGNGLGFKLSNQTLPFDRLNLSNAEKNALIAFMRIL
ncbi:cytochrome c peroxidase [Dyadobacter subterraneus]